MVRLLGSLALVQIQMLGKPNAFKMAQSTITIPRTLLDVPGDLKEASVVSNIASVHSVRLWEQVGTSQLFRCLT